MSYNLSPDQEYQLIQLILYVLGFVTLILIFLYIAYERPGVTRRKTEEEEE
jgi:hypothetical protein